MDTDDHQGRSGGRHPDIDRHRARQPGPENGNGKRTIDLEIREMEIDDIPEVFHLGEQIFTAEETPTLYRTWDEFEVTSLFNSDQEFCLVAEMSGQIVGFALGTTVSKRKSAWKYGYIVWMGTLPSCQRQGIATKIFDELAEKMGDEGVRIFLVDTEADNLAALNFFRKKGFGSPQEHIYLTLNQRTYEQSHKKPQSAHTT
jgi:ribosomal protein S18 acetylase RimI-like enzyme